MAIAKKNKIENFKSIYKQMPVDLFKPKTNSYVSQSILLGYLQCDRMFVYNANRWEKPGSENNFFFGNCCHELMDFFYSSGMNPTKKHLEKAFDGYFENQKSSGAIKWMPFQVQEYYKAIVLTVMEAYFEIYADDFKMEFLQVEEVFQVPYTIGNETIILGGKRDGLLKINKHKKLFEHKTKSFIDEDSIELSLNQDFQSLYYLFTDYLESGTYGNGVLYNIIRKPGQRQGKSEKLKSYCDRIYNDIVKNPSHYFIRYDVEYEKSDFADFEYELNIKLKRLIDIARKREVPLKNESRCTGGKFNCPFLSACANNSMQGYVQRKELHPELL